MEWEIRIELVDPRTWGSTFLGFFEGESQHSPDHPRAVLEEAECELWLAFDRDQPRGGILTRQEHPVDSASFGAIENLIVVREWRRRGIGRRLMQEAEAEFRLRRLDEMQLSTDVWNEPAIQLYTQLGYRTVRTYTRVRNGIESERYRMRKPLQPDRGLRT